MFSVYLKAPLQGISIFMRYKLFLNDLGTHYIMDNYTDQIIGKKKKEKLATRIVQKLNKLEDKEKSESNIH